MLSPSFLGVAAAVESICTRSDEDLASVFFDVAGVGASERSGSLRLMRWPKETLTISVFQDRSANAPSDPLQRNLAIFRAIGALGALFKFEVNSKTADGDIELTFLSAGMQRHVWANLPEAVIAAEQPNGCPVYLDVGEDGGQTRAISKAHILVVSEMKVEDMPTCIKIALVNALGLIGWPYNSSDDLSNPENYKQLQIYLSVLYGPSKLERPADLRTALEASRFRACR